MFTVTLNFKLIKTLNKYVELEPTHSPHPYVSKLVFAE